MSLVLADVARVRRATYRTLNALLPVLTTHSRVQAAVAALRALDIFFDFPDCDPQHVLTACRDTLSRCLAVFATHPRLFAAAGRLLLRAARA